MSEDQPFMATMTTKAPLYERDTVLWAEEQAELLRQAAAGTPSPNIDWANIIEEIESVGRSLVNAVESLLLQALVHELKAQFWPDTPYVEGWLNESRLFQAQAAAQFMPSMRQRIDAKKLVQRAGRVAHAQTIDGRGPSIPERDSERAALYFLQRWLLDPDNETFGQR